LIVTAWWHDLGYSLALRTTGCHQIDGARFLTEQAYPDRLSALVANHAAATYKEQARGHFADLEVWPREEGAIADGLWTADMTTGPGMTGFEPATSSSRTRSGPSADLRDLSNLLVRVLVFVALRRRCG